MKNNLYAVILAGGYGQRYWPASRQKRPKQFLKITGGRSFIQQTVDRVKLIAAKGNIFIMTNKEQAPAMRNELPGVKNIIAEPASRNTAAAIGLAAVLIEKQSPDALMAVLPTDHMIRDIRSFARTIKRAADIALRDDVIVAVGTRPHFASTGYGYLKVKKLKNRAYKVEKFIEKPNEKKAGRFFRDKRFLWNDGMFIFRTSAIMEEIRLHTPKLHRGLNELKVHVGKKSFTAMLDKIYPRFDDISVDYAIMEKSKKVMAVEADFDWLDMGSWVAMAHILKKDSSGNAATGNFFGLNTKNSIIIARKKHLLATLGVSDIIVVDTKDATLVADIDNAEQVKKLVRAMDCNPGLKRFL